REVEVVLAIYEREVDLVRHVRHDELRHVQDRAVGTDETNVLVGGEPLNVAPDPLAGDDSLLVDVQHHVVRREVVVRSPDLETPRSARARQYSALARHVRGVELYLDVAVRERLSAGRLDVAVEG